MFLSFVFVRFLACYLLLAADRTKYFERQVIGLLSRRLRSKKLGSSMSGRFLVSDSPRERAGWRPGLRTRTGSFAMAWFYCLMIVLGSGEQGAAEATDWMKPPSWTGNFWGPAATRSRKTGETSAAADERGNDTLESLGQGCPA